jgi:hypothetical protein
MMRYIRAFWTALQMTLRGDSPAPSPYASLSEWMEQAARLVDAVIKAANSHHLDSAALKIIKARIDGRDTNVEIVLALIKHHMNEEYPYLLRHMTRNNINAIHASNLNDVYRIESLIDLPALQDAAIKQSLTTLKAHLETIPPQISQ